MVRISDTTVPAHIPEHLTKSPAKQRLYSVDTYFRDSWEDLRQVAGDDAGRVAQQHAFLLLKPDAVVRRRLAGALDWLADRSWHVVYADRFLVNRWAVRAFWQYQWNTATRDRRDIADLYMPATDSLVLLLRAPHDTEWATSALTRIKGGSEPGACKPGSLRSALGTLNQQLNLVHSADEPGDLVREIGICWTEPGRKRVYESMVGGGDARESARTLAGQLESEHDYRDLSLSATINRLTAFAGGGTEPDRNTLTRLLSGGVTDWRELVRVAERCGFPVSRWDRVVLGTHLLTPTLTGIAPLIPDASGIAVPPARLSTNHHG